MYRFTAFLATNFQAFQPIFPESDILSNQLSERYNTPMKVKGNGQGKVLTANELKRLFSDGLILNRDRCLFAICLFTGCRISEALSLQVTDIKNKTIT